MLVEHYEYSALHADMVTLADGETLEITDAASNARVYGVYVYSGRSDVVSGSNAGQSWLPTGAFRLNDVTRPCTVQATGETVWLCVSQNDKSRRTVLPQVVAGEYTLPAGWGFLVLDGTLQAEGKTAVKADYFAPRAAPVELSGAASILLVL